MTPSTPIYRDQLEAVYALIEKPENWTQEAFAKTADGDAVNSDDADAVCWCIRGAFIRCHGWPKASLADALGVVSVIGFNDAENRKHAEVLALLKSAIERAPVRHP
jgi:hypothetical protein